ncbi:hypothetical protein [Lentzea albida]|uniref:hypothetical protein n=1 Tax=Lentzea albida TaxID=65499 RepID=UPI0015A556C7|nr:hypothetical protein [Lentzea albida]
MFAVLGFLLAAVLAGVAGAYLEEATGQIWVRFLPLVVVVVVAMIAMFRSGLIPPKK